MGDDVDKIFDVFNKDQEIGSWDCDTLAMHLAKVLQIQDDREKTAAVREWCAKNNKKGVDLTSDDDSIPSWLTTMQKDLGLFEQQSQRALGGAVRNLRMFLQSLLPPLSGFKRVYHLDFHYTEEHDFLFHRGQAAYVNPKGWTRLAIYPDMIDDDQEEVLKNWHVAYHGTPSLNLRSIISNGLLCPGTTIDGKIIEKIHTSGVKPGKGHVYVSPSIWYSSHWVYTQCPKGGYESGRKYDQVKQQYEPRTRQDSHGKTHFVHYVFQVRVRPGSYRTQGNTFVDREYWGDGNAAMSGEYGNRQVPYDFNFGTHELEWLIADSSDVRITGLMFRQSTVEPKQEVRDLFTANKARWAQRRDKLTRDGEGAGEFNCFSGKVVRPSTFKWQWNGAPASGDTLSDADDAPWQDYAAEQCHVMERAYVQGQKTVYLGQMGPQRFHYFVNMDSRIQINAGDDQNWRQRRVRRVPA